MHAFFLKNSNLLDLPNLWTIPSERMKDHLLSHSGLRQRKLGPRQQFYNAHNAKWQLNHCGLNFFGFSVFLNCISVILDPHKVYLDLTKNSTMAQFCFIQMNYPSSSLHRPLVKSRRLRSALIALLSPLSPPCSNTEKGTVLWWSFRDSGNWSYPYFGVS